MQRCKSRQARSPSCSSTVIEVLKPQDVVLAEIAAGLHLDQLKVDLAWIRLANREKYIELGNGAR